MKETASMPASFPSRSLNWLTSGQSIPRPHGSWSSVSMNRNLSVQSPILPDPCTRCSVYQDGFGMEKPSVILSTGDRCRPLNLPIPMSSQRMTIWTTVSAKLDASLSSRHVMRLNPSILLRSMNKRDEIFPGEKGPIRPLPQIPFSQKESRRSRHPIHKNATYCVTFRTRGKFFKMVECFCWQVCVLGSPKLRPLSFRDCPVRMPVHTGPCHCSQRKNTRPLIP